LVNTARYLFPLAETAGLVTVRLVLVAPEMFAKPEPESTCHCTVGVGFPFAPAVKVASDPYVTILSCGCATTDGAVQAAVVWYPEKVVDGAEFVPPEPPATVPVTLEVTSRFDPTVLVTVAEPK
jgi:hypothetical protein